MWGRGALSDTSEAITGKVNPRLARLWTAIILFLNIFFRDVGNGVLWSGSAAQSPLLWDG